MHGAIMDRRSVAIILRADELTFRVRDYRSRFTLAAQKATL